MDHVVSAISVLTDYTVFSGVCQANRPMWDVSLQLVGDARRQHQVLLGSQDEGRHRDVSQVLARLGQAFGGHAFIG